MMNSMMTDQLSSWFFQNFVKLSKRRNHQQVSNVFCTLLAAKWNSQQMCPENWYSPHDGSRLWPTSVICISQGRHPISSMWSQSTVSSHTSVTPVCSLSFHIHPNVVHHFSNFCFEDSQKNEYLTHVPHYAKSHFSHTLSNFPFLNKIHLFYYCNSNTSLPHLDDNG